MPRTEIAGVQSVFNLTPSSISRADLWQSLVHDYDFRAPLGSGRSVVVNLAPGFYGDSFVAYGMPLGLSSSQDVIFVGSSDPNNPTFLRPTAGPWAFSPQNGAKFSIENCRVEGTAAAEAAIAITAGSEIGIGPGVTFGPNPGIDINPSVGGTVQFYGGGVTIDKTNAAYNSVAFLQGDRGHLANIAGPGLNVTVKGAPHWTGACVMCDGGLMNLAGMNFTAMMSGAPFLVYDSGCIVTGASGPGGLPENPGYFCCDTAHVAIGLVKGSCLVSLSQADAATLAALAGSNPNLFLVCAGLKGGTTYDPANGLSQPAIKTGTFDCYAGGFLYSGGQYLGASPII